MTRISRPVQIVLAIAAVVAVAWLVRGLFPSEQQRIRAELDRLVAIVNQRGEGFDAISRAAQVGAAFTEDASINLGEGGPLRGRDTIMAVVARVQPRADRPALQVRDVDVLLGSDARHADVELTATYTDEAGAMDAREFHLQLVKPESRWLIAHVEPVEVMKK